MSENKEKQENNVVPIRPDLENLINIGKRRKGPGKLMIRLTILTLLLAIVVSLLIFGAQFGSGRIRRFFTSLGTSDGSVVEYSFDDGQKNIYAAYQNSLAAVTGYGLTTFNSAGEEVGTIQHVYSTPLLQAGNQLVMVCDIGLSQLTVMDSAGDAVLDLQSKGTFLDANLSYGDTLSCIELNDGYRSVLSVYDHNQNRIFRWYSSSSYFNQCAVSDDASYLCAVRLGNDGNQFESTAVLFRTTMEEPIAEVSVGEQLIHEVCFLNYSTIAVIGENSTVFLNCDGEVLNEYDYGAAHLRGYSISQDGFIVLSLNMYQAGNQYSVVTLNTKGEKLAEQYIGEEVISLSSAGKYSAVLTPTKLLIYNEKLTLYASTEELQSVSSVVMLEDGSVILLGGGSGTLRFLQ